VSLLLDALKRAEQAKRAKTGPETASSGKPSKDFSEPRTTPLALDEFAPESSVSARPEKNSVPEIANRDFGLVDHPETAPAHGPAPAQQSASPDSPTLPKPAASRKATPVNAAAQDASREIAKNVFSAKQPVAYVERRSKPWLAPLIATSIVVLGFAGWYIWNNVSRSLVSPFATTMAPAHAPALPAASVSTGQPGVSASEREKSPVGTMTSAVDEASIPPMLPPALVAAPTRPSVPAKNASRNEQAPLSDRELLAQNLKRSPVIKDAPVRLKLAQSVAPPAVNQDVAIGYAALANGDYASAARAYSKAAQSDPLNIDAHLGLATAAARSDDIANAAKHYRRALELDPRNGTALAGLLALSAGRTENVEVELKTLLARDANSSSLQFALGNLYAGEKRWTEAQQAFFEAYRLDSGNPDFIFNLAVSLDQLNQSRLALDYYQKAIAESAKGRGAQFDRTAAQRRITELQSIAKG
jgi:Tfp pilus assembly protein PilF